MPPELKRIYMHGGPQDGRFVHVLAETNHVDVVVYTPPSLIEPPSTHLAPQRPLFQYRPRGRRTLQGIEIFELV